MVSKIAPLAIGTLLSFLPIVRPVQASIVDVAGVQGWLMMLDDQGDIWLWDLNLPSYGCAWHLAGSFPGAVAFDWEGGNSTPVGAILTNTGQIHNVQFFNNTTVVVASTITHPFADPVDVGYTASNGGYWIKRGNGELWFLWGGQWLGPCDLPSPPVSVSDKSWGAAKSAYR